MTPERWREIEALFDRVVDLPAAEREAVLAGQNPELRSAVEELISSDGAGEEVVREAILEGEALLDLPPVEPQRFGAYRVCGVIGQGGMGSVYSARRDDGVYDKEVAIKILHFGAETTASIERFRQERRILATLEHPNIARLIDGGETPGGLPYIVLEYIQGEPINAHCDRNHLSRDQRLRLFNLVCDAVQHAHRNLIVHRDLKPSNILVQPDGTPKLLDFGIAKLLDSDGERTGTHLQAMSPQYASPEQVRGKTISTSTDVYSLGVVLYQLLTGRMPYEIPLLTPLEIDRVVSEVAPDPPGVSGDLDNIILMALRKEAERRYASPRDLADDIERFLNHEPVRASPDTWGYRVGKFARRRWGALAAGLAISVAIGGGVASTLYQARIANQRFTQVRKLARNVVFDIHDEIAKVEGSTKARQMVVRTALEYLDDLRGNAGNDAGLREELAGAYVKIGSALGYPGEPNLGQTKDALANYAKAETLYEGLATTDAAKRVDLAVFYGRSARLRQLTGDFTGAEERLLKAVAILEPLHLQKGPSDRVEEEYARILVALATFQDDHKGDSVLAVQTLTRAKGVVDGLLHHGRTVRALTLAQSVQAAFNALASIGRLSEAISALDAQQKILGELLTLEPRNPTHRRQLTVSYQDKAVIYFEDFAPSFEDPVRATAEARRYLALAEESSAADASNNAAKFSLAIARSRLAASERFLAPVPALATARSAVQTLERIQQTRPGFLNLSRLPRLRRILAEALLEAKNYAEAIRVAGQAVTEQRALIANHPKDESIRFYLTATLYTAGRASAAAGDVASAHERFQEAHQLADRELTARPKSLLCANAARKIAEALAANARVRGEAAEAERWSSAARNVWDRYQGPPNEFISLHRGKVD